MHNGGDVTGRTIIGRSHAPAYIAHVSNSRVVKCASSFTKKDRTA